MMKRPQAIRIANIQKAIDECPMPNNRRMLGDHLDTNYHQMCADIRTNPKYFKIDTFADSVVINERMDTEQLQLDSETMIPVVNAGEESVRKDNIDHAAETRLNRIAEGVENNGIMIEASAGDSSTGNRWIINQLDSVLKILNGKDAPVENSKPTTKNTEKSKEEDKPPAPKKDYIPIVRAYEKNVIEKQVEEINKDRDNDSKIASKDMWEAYVNPRIKCLLNNARGLRKKAQVPEDGRINGNNDQPISIEHAIQLYKVLGHELRQLKAEHGIYGYLIERDKWATRKENMQGDAKKLYEE